MTATSFNAVAVAVTAALLSCSHNAINPGVGIPKHQERQEDDRRTGEAERSPHCRTSTDQLLAISPDGLLAILQAEETGVISFYRLPDLRRLGTVEMDGVRRNFLTRVTFSSDSKLLFATQFDVTSDDGGSQGFLFDVNTMKRLRSFHFKKAPPFNAQFDPTGNHIFGMSTDYGGYREISRLSLADGSEQRRQVPEETETFAAVSPDSILLSAYHRPPGRGATGQFQLQLMSWKNGKVTHQTPFVDSPYPILDLDVSQDGRLVAGARGHAQVWQLPELKEAGALKTEGGSVRFARFAPDGTMLTEADGKSRAVAIVRGRANGTVFSRYEIPGLSNLILGFPDDGSIVLGVDDSIFRFDFATGEELPAIRPPLCLHDSEG
jgi:WD40 repeat protein